MSNSILFSDPNFDDAISSKCELLIRIGLDTFSYAIINTELNKVEVLFEEQECNDLVAKFQEKLDQDKYLNISYKSVKIAIHTPNVVNIPLPIYHRDELEIYTQYFADTDFCTVLTRPLQQHQCVFSINSTIDDLLNDQFIDSKIYNGFHALIENQQSQHHTLIFDFSVKSFSVIYLKAGLLNFQQVYEFENAEEFNYYLLLIVSQLSISPTTTVLLSGIIHQTDNAYHCLSLYFSTISFNRINGLNTEIIDDMPSQYYVSLLALSACE